MNYIKKILLNVVLIAFVLFIPVLSLAADGDGNLTSDSKVVNPLGTTTTLTGLIKTVLIGLIKIGSPIIVLAIIYSGFLFVAAQGNSEKLEEAKRSLVYTLIGAAILLGSWAIAELISSTVLAL